MYFQVFGFKGKWAFCKQIFNNLERRRVMVETAEYPGGNKIEPHDALSEDIIPAVPGEFYSYSSKFTIERPVYALLKCKANKSRTLTSLAELGDEANLVCLFGRHGKYLQICSIGKAHSLGFLSNCAVNKSFDETCIRFAGITTKSFYDLRMRKNAETLVKICRLMDYEHQTSVVPKPGDIFALMTGTGKYGMFLVKELAPTSIKIDACHILLK